MMGEREGPKTRIETGYAEGQEIWHSIRMVSRPDQSIPRRMTRLKMPIAGIGARYCVPARASKSSSKYRPFGYATPCQPRPLLNAEYSMARTCLQRCFVRGLQNEYLESFLLCIRVSFIYTLLMRGTVKKGYTAGNAEKSIFYILSVLFMSRVFYPTLGSHIIHLSLIHCTFNLSFYNT